MTCRDHRPLVDQRQDDPDNERDPDRPAEIASLRAVRARFADDRATADDGWLVCRDRLS